MAKFVGMSAVLAMGLLAFALECRAAGAHFSNANLQGTYVVKFQGTNSGGGALKLGAPVLAALIDKTIFAVSPDEARYNFGWRLHRVARGRCRPDSGDRRPSAFDGRA